jgi:predicted transcriptional regulator
MFDQLEITLKTIQYELAMNREILQLIVGSLTTKSQVAKFLGVNPKTVKNYIDDGRFQEGLEYFYDENGIEVFIPNAILKFKQDQKHKKIEVKKIEKQLDPIALKFLTKKAC